MSVPIVPQRLPMSSWATGNSHFCPTWQQNFDDNCPKAGNKCHTKIWTKVNFFAQRIDKINERICSKCWHCSCHIYQPGPRPPHDRPPPPQLPDQGTGRTDPGEEIRWRNNIWKLLLPTCGWYSGSSPWWLTTRSPSCPLRVMQACAGAKLLISKTNPITILLAGLGANPIWGWSPASSFILEAGCEYKWGLDLLYSQPTNQVLVGPPRIQDQVGRSRRTATRHRWLGGLVAAPTVAGESRRHSLDTGQAVFDLLH